MDVRQNLKTTSNFINRIRNRLELVPVLLALAISIMLIALIILYPLALLITLGLDSIPSALSTYSFLEAVEATMIYSTLSSIIAIVMGTPLAYVMARYEFRAKGVVDALIDIPIMIPHIIVGIMVVLAFVWYGIGPVLRAHGINFINTLWGATTAVAFLSSTYYIRVVETAISMVNPEMEIVARTLGAGPLRTFTTIVLPRIWRSMASGALLTWARSASEAGALFIVAYYVYLHGNLVYPVPVYIYGSYVGIGLVNAVKYSAALVVLMLAVFIIYRLLISVGGTTYRLGGAGG
ncbi:ABC transporter permease [Vulcanisaeta thermophila]|uniref:ABC transporter permease n=1 Tax=Vulcanisaeta thermophila TaxID=867917 RepID=UPI000A01AACF|nr:ABC transporter permease [Vulcanisaeta thermophila]